MKNQFMKNAISEVLMDMMHKKRLRKITVSDIVNECGISKQTFYNHFEDKFDLIRYACYAINLKSLKASKSSGLSYEKAIERLYRKSVEIKYFYKAFVDDPEYRLILLDVFAECSYAYISNQIITAQGSSRIPQDLDMAIEFNAAGNAMLFVNWVARDMQTSPEVMAAANYNCIPEILRKYFDAEKINAYI